MAVHDSPAPGWYPDPDGSGRERFWDGRLWTAQRAPAATRLTPPPLPHGASYNQTSSLCPNGHQNRLGQRFCGQCSAPIATQAATPRPPLTMNPKVVAICTVAAVAAIAVVGIVIWFGSGSSDTTAASSSTTAVTGTQGNWIEAVCKTGTFHDGAETVAGSSASAYCHARAADTEIYISEYDSDYRMRNAIAMLRIKYYVAARREDGVVVAFGALHASTSAPLEPLTQFGFTITTASIN